MRPIKEWSLAQFWWLAIGLAIAARLAETGICSAFGCTVPDWVATLTEILAFAIVFVIAAIVWRLKQGRTDELRKAWRLWLFCLVGAPPIAAVNTGMVIGFHGPHATHSFDWYTALRVLASFAVLSGLLLLISLGVRRVIRHYTGIA